MAVTKYLLLAVVLAAFAAVEATPVQQSQDIDFEAVARKFQEDAQRQFEEFKRRAQTNFNGVQQLPTLDVKNLPKDGNTHVYGESESKYHVETNINGRKSEESGGHKVVNDDGKISEYDLP